MNEKIKYHIKLRHNPTTRNAFWTACEKWYPPKQELCRSYHREDENVSGCTKQACLMLVIYFEDNSISLLSGCVVYWYMLCRRNENQDFTGICYIYLDWLLCSIHKRKFFLQNDHWSFRLNEETLKYLFQEELSIWSGNNFSFQNGAQRYRSIPMLQKKGRVRCTLSHDLCVSNSGLMNVSYSS